MSLIENWRVIETIVINASPLIFLSRGHHIDLLRHFGKRILVPQSVKIEIQRKGPDDVTTRTLHENSWIECIPDVSVPDTIREWGLGAGESSVLAYALQEAGSEAVIDDLAARKCAACHAIPVRGTLGIVLAARKRGYIPSAREIMNDLIRGGMFLSRDLLNAALQKVGE